MQTLTPETRNAMAALGDLLKSLADVPVAEADPLTTAPAPPPLTALENIQIVQLPFTEEQYMNVIGKVKTAIDSQKRLDMLGQRGVEILKLLSGALALLG